MSWSPDEKAYVCDKKSCGKPIEYAVTAATRYFYGRFGAHGNNAPPGTPAAILLAATRSAGNGLHFCEACTMPAYEALQRWCHR